jgi:GTPases - translation elongation factors
MKFDILAWMLILKSVVSGGEMFRKILDQGQAGDNAGITISRCG